MVPTHAAAFQVGQIQVRGNLAVQIAAQPFPRSRLGVRVLNSVATRRHFRRQMYLHAHERQSWQIHEYAHSVQVLRIRTRSFRQNRRTKVP